MGVIKQSDFDKLVTHTVRIELKDGSTLIYWVSVESKTALYQLIKKDAISDNDNEFLWFYIPEDRLVLINKKQIMRITFCFDPPDGKDPQYHDNFGLVISEEEELENGETIETNAGNEIFIPQLIIAHNRQLEKTEIVDKVTMQTEGYFGNVSSYSDLSEGDVEGFEFEYIDDEEEWVLTTYKYLQFVDDDGEDNFMPLENLFVIEAERPLLMSDEKLDLYLNRK